MLYKVFILVFCGFYEPGARGESGANSLYPLITHVEANSVKTSLNPPVLLNKAMVAGGKP
ncbi:hypothetical protein Pogu_1381 [Pyrobaculum oguniense TE7]|uniref:Uncharacterized protein n=1 Tax=Pyrobaculum oguniense (strain DSM 13380 / JCM 10595 / TE7) TaxID=698757 RepID=H6Q950_PYROT|nr:hypothetical protein Pogu_1381 [Pyrobaculum oguniense TE7]